MDTTDAEVRLHIISNIARGSELDSDVSDLLTAWCRSWGSRAGSWRASFHRYCPSADVHATVAAETEQAAR